MLTIVGLVIGPFAGFFGKYSLFYIRSLFRADCMWRLEAAGVSLFIGAPLGLVTFGLIGRWAGKLLDEWDLLESQREAAKEEAEEEGAEDEKSPGQ